MSRASSSADLSSPLLPQNARQYVEEAQLCVPQVSMTDNPQISLLNNHHHQPQLSSVGKTFGNIIISIVGAGVLGLPYTFKRTGWLLSALVLVIISLACYYCMMLLVWSRKKLEKDVDHHIKTFSDLGFLLYGKWGRLAVDSMLVISQGAFCVTYLIFIGENLTSIFGKDVAWSNSSSADHLDRLKLIPAEFNTEVSQSEGFALSKAGYIWVVFPFQVALASIRTLTMLAPFSIVADIANGVSMAVVMQQDIAMFIQNGISTISANRGLCTLPFAIGVAIYAFEGFGLVLQLESSMRDKKLFGGVLGLAMVCITFLYMAFGFLGYLAFGDETRDIVTLNLGTSWKTTVVKLGLCVGLFFTFAIMMFPVHELMERRLARGRRSMIVRTVIVVVATLCAVAVPHFGDFVSLVGNSVCCTLAFVLPALFHMKTLKGDITKSMLYLDYIIILFGITYGIGGTISAIQNMLMV